MPNFQTHKEQNKFIIFTHAAAAGNEGAPVRQRGVTMAESQTHALSTIRALLMKSAEVTGLPGSDQTSAPFCVPAGGLLHFIRLRGGFRVDNQPAIPTLDTDSSPHLLPLFLKTLLVHVTRVVEADSLSLFSIQSPNSSQGKLSGCAVTS